MSNVHIAYDIETNAGESFATLRGFNTIHCMSYAVADSATDLNKAVVKRAVGLDSIRLAVTAWLLTSRAGTNVYLWGHNTIGFDNPVLEDLLMLPKGSITLPALLSNIHIMDTAMLAKLVYPDLARTVSNNPRWRKYPVKGNSLKAWGYRCGVHKTNIGDPQADETWEKYTDEMGDYCDDDVKVTVALVGHLLKAGAWLFSPKCRHIILMETRFAQLIRAQQTNGVEFDECGARELSTKIRHEMLSLEEEMAKVFPAETFQMKTPEYYEYRCLETDQLHFTGVTRAACEILRKDHNRKINEGRFPKSRLLMPRQNYYKAGPLKTYDVPFNPASGKHVVKRLGELHGWEPVIFTAPTDKFPEGQPKVDEETLGGLPYPEAKLIVRWMNLSKVYGMLAGDTKSSWLNNVQSTGRIHGAVDSLGTNTGRCAHYHPNLGQVPSARKAYGAECRDLFGPRKGWKFMGCDASGLELRCLAHYLHPFDDGEYTDVVLNGDVHTHNQNNMGAETRDDAKTTAYCILYGGAGKAVAAALGVGLRAGSQVRKDWLSNTTGLNELLEAVKAAFRQRKWVRGLDGRRHYPRSDHSCFNCLLQGAGAIIMKVALIELYFMMVELGFPLGSSWALCLQVHDEFQIEFHPDVIDEELLKRLSCEAITRAGELLEARCPLAGEAAVGTSWKETH